MNPASQHRCVFVGNIPYDATEEKLIQICEEVGPVVSFRLVIDRDTGKPKGYGFCEYKDEETALSARRNLQGYDINGRQLRVDFAENDKGTDRNQQGRGGPGLTANMVDAQKPPLGGPPMIGDASLYQPIGVPLAANAASVMAEVLGGVQTDNTFPKQGGLHGQSGSNIDSLTHYLANMPRKHLYDVMSNIKVVATQNNELAHQLLTACPQLTKALFQAEILLGMATSEMLQMPNIRQSLQPSFVGGMQNQKPTAIPSYPGQPLIQGNVPLNTVVNSSSYPPPYKKQVPVQPRFPHPQHPQIPLPTRPQAPTIEASTVVHQQPQFTSLPSYRPTGGTTLGNNSWNLPNATNVNLQNSYFPYPSSSQSNFQPGTSQYTHSSGVPDRGYKQGEVITLVTNSIPLALTSNRISNLKPDKRGRVEETSEMTNHPSKVARLEDGMSNLNQNIPVTSGFGPTPVIGNGLAASPQGFVEVIHNTEMHSNQLQFISETESALLQQVMALTPEQLSALTPEQRQQVLQLQQMLR